MTKYSKVTLTRGRTINLGNFESARVDVSIEAFCDNEKDPFDTFDILVQDVECFLEEQIERIVAQEK